MGDKVVDLLAVRGTTHTGCIEHSKELLALPRRRVLLISRDRDNNPWRSKEGSFLRPATGKLNTELDITDTASGSLHLGYRRLLDIFQEAVTAGRVQENINAELD